MRSLNLFNAKAQSFRDAKGFGKTISFFLCIFASWRLCVRVFFLSFVWFWEFSIVFPALAQVTATPTPPPPPVGVTPSPSKNPPPNGGGNKKPTKTPTPRPSGYLPPKPTGTPTITPTPSETPTPTPTLPPTLIRLVVFMDDNRNGAFDTGEGIDDLLVMARWGDWLTYGTTENGVLFLTIPQDIPVGTQIAVETPYLHWSAQVKTPEQSGTAEAVLRLELPEFPVFLP